MRSLLVGLLILFFLTACGQSGRLYLPNQLQPALPDKSQEDSGEKV